MSKINDATRDDLSNHDGNEPIHDAAHVRDAIARFRQVNDVTDAERDAAWERIRIAANEHGVELAEWNWRELS